MNWYQGNIADAVQKSKEQNAIFVVFVEGKDESTQKLAQFINEERIRVKLQSSDFMAIKIESDSESYMQFARIYQVVPVPSIFFIGKSGTPLEIGTSVMASADELDQKIDKVLAASGKSTPSVSATSSFIAAEQQAAVAVAAPALPASSAAAATVKAEDAAAAAPAAVVDAAEPSVANDGDEIVCEGDVCFKKPKESKAAEQDASPTAATDTEKEEPVVATEVKPPSASVTAAVEDGATAVTDAVAANKRIEETRKLLEQKRRERVELEKKEEKERELQRRRDGKDTQHLQDWQRETELRELKDSIRRNRLEEQAERERIRAQIAGDRAERATKSATEAERAVSNATSSPPQAKQKPQQQQQLPSGDADTARLQFRFSSGDNRTHTFNSLDTLGQVRAYVVAELLPGTGIRDFVLATTYPKREFAAEHDEQTLVQLGLVPSAVILVIGKERSSSSPAAIIARSGGIVNVLSTIFWTVLSPVFAVFDYIKNIGNRRGAAAPDNDGTQKRANEEQDVQHDAAKRRNLDRFMTGPSTSMEANAADSPPKEENEPKPYRRYGGSNVHRLTDNRKDSDDENATWNGNSTQQQ